MYDTYSRYIYEFLQEHWVDIENTLSTLQNVLVMVEYLLQAVCYFGLLFFAFKFIRARWLTLS